jgi:two-component system phosphate regulon sensor histidine kinase PhoR
MAQLRQDVLARTPIRQVQVRADSNAKLLGEEIQIHSAFSNLVDNAAKYTPPDGLGADPLVDRREGRSFLGLRHRHRDCRRTISHGSPSVFIGSIRAAAGPPGGSGLGLAIVKHVLQRHGAHLSIESEEGRGSQFTCHFPRERVQNVLAWWQLRRDRPKLRCISRAKSNGCAIF